MRYTSKMKRTPHDINNPYESKRKKKQKNKKKLKAPNKENINKI